MIGSVRRERGGSAENTEESDDNGERRETDTCTIQMVDCHHKELFVERVTYL